MSGLIDFGSCGKWQKETLEAHCVKANGGNGVVYEELNKYLKGQIAEDDDLYVSWFGGDVAGCWLDVIVPPKHLFLKALDIKKKRGKGVYLESFAAKLGSFRVEYIGNKEDIVFISDYSKLLSFIKNDIGYKFINDWNSRGGFL